MKIYKYFTLENALKYLMNNELIFSCVKSYNDPFEGASMLAECFGKSNRSDNAPSLFDDNYIPGGRDLVEAKIDEYKNAIACCFSRTYSDLLLWSHYAECHRGIVVCFDLNEIVRSLPEGNILEKSGNILYCNEISMISGELNQAINKKVREAYLRKAKCWSYEEEVRCILTNNNSIFPKLAGFNDKYTVKIPQTAIVDIYCGVACSNHIGYILNAFLMKYEIDAKVYNMEKSDSEYKIILGKRHEKYVASSRDVDFKMNDLKNKFESQDGFKALNDFVVKTNLIDSQNHS